MKSCLIVDDSSVVRKVARRIIEDLNFDIEEAEDGAVAVHCCQGRLPDVILLDLNMPNMDGLEFLKTLRKMPRGDIPAVVFCSTENDLSHIRRALDAGADEYIMKPFDRDIIRMKLQSLGILPVAPSISSAS